MEKEFIHLITRHIGILYKICHFYCRDTEDRKDLLQEMVLQLWKAYPKFRQESAVSTWMYRIGLNTAISNFRKQKRNILSTPFSDAAFEIPEPVFADRENTDALQRAITCLNTAEKAVIILYLEEKSYEEMAQILGISKTNVGVKLSRIKYKLEILLKSDIHEPR